MKLVILSRFVEDSIQIILKLNLVHSMGSEPRCDKIIKDNAHIGDVLTYVALGILGQSTRTHWKPPYVLMHIWSFVQLFCLVVHSSMSVIKHQHSKTLI